MGKEVDQQFKSSLCRALKAPVRSLGPVPWAVRSPPLAFPILWIMTLASSPRIGITNSVRARTFPRLLGDLQTGPSAPCPPSVCSGCGESSHIPSCPRPGLTPLVSAFLLGVAGSDE